MRQASEIPAWQRSARLPAAQNAGDCSAQAAGSSTLVLNRIIDEALKDPFSPLLLCRALHERQIQGVLCVVVSIQAAGDTWLATAWQHCFGPLSALQSLLMLSKVCYCCCIYLHLQPATMLVQ